MNPRTDGDHRFDVAIIGAGVVGCAIARALAQYQLSVVVIERSSDVGNGTSKANTAILHTGFDCVPGSLESSLVSRGYHQLRDYAALTGIAFEPTGALVVAWDEEQEAVLTALQEKAEKNGYGSTRLLGADEVRQREPNLGVGARGALAVPGESIICPWSTTLAYAREAYSAGVAFAFDTQVTSVHFDDEGQLLNTTRGERRSRWLINAAGLFSGEVDRFCQHHAFHVQPRRGELIVFDKLSRPLINAIILPVPNSRTKGVLVAPTVYGNLLLGPTADDVDDASTTGTTEQGIARLLDAGRRILPRLLDEEVTALYAGLRAATEHSDYQIQLHRDEAYVCVGGIRSTGLTASMAIADHVVGLLRNGGLPLVRRHQAPLTPTMPPLGSAQRRPYDDARLIASDAQYGDIICHCEQVTRGEIRDACAGPWGAPDLGALRRRTRALNGRCQGFYCGAEVAALWAALTGAPRVAPGGRDE